MKTARAIVLFCIGYAAESVLHILRQRRKRAVLRAFNEYMDGEPDQ